MGLSVCPRWYLQNHTKFFVHVACVCGSVLLRHVYNRPHRVSLGRGFSPLTMHISPEPHRRSLTNFLCMLPMSVAQSSSDMFTIGRIAYRRKGFSSRLKIHNWPGKGDGSAQCRRSMLSTIALLLLRTECWRCCWCRWIRMICHWTCPVRRCSSTSCWRSSRRNSSARRWTWSRKSATRSSRTSGKNTAQSNCLLLLFGLNSENTVH